MNGRLKRKAPFDPVGMAMAGVGAFRAFKRARRFARSFTRTVRRKKDYNGFNSGYSIVNRKAVNTKRRLRRSRKFRKRRAMRQKRNRMTVAAQLTEHFFKRTIAMNEQELSAGAIALANAYVLNPTSASYNWKYLPLHLYDITDVSTHDNQTGLTNCCQQLVWNYANITGGMQYQVLDSVPRIQTSDGDGVNPRKYTLNSTIMTSNAGPNVESTRQPIARKWYYHGCKVDLMMYGQTNQDTLYRVDVVRFHPKMIDWMNAVGKGDALVDPTAVIEDSYSGPTKADWKQFWHSLIAPYTQNPMIRRVRGKFMKIVKSYKFKIPEQSGDFDRQPCVKTKIYIPFNKVLNRYWHKGTHNTNQSTDPEHSGTLNVADYDGYYGSGTVNGNYGGGKIDPKWRTFLMIRATNTDLKQSVEEITGSPVMEIQPGGDPTYDIKIESKFSYVRDSTLNF